MMPTEHADLARAFDFVHAMREIGAVLTLCEDGQVCFDATHVEWADAFGATAIRFAFHRDHDAIAEVLRSEQCESSRVQ